MDDELLAELEDLNDYEDDSTHVNVTFKLANSTEFTSLMDKLSAQLNNEEEEYQVILQATKAMVDVDTEVLLIFKYIKDLYSKRFPELEQLVPAPLDYARIVKQLGNDLDLSKVDLKASCNLPQATVMIITVASTTTKGSPLTEQELVDLNQTIEMMMYLEDCRKAMMQYIESRMHVVAPNLSALVGSSTAAQLISVAGGLTALSKIPACNMMLLGKQAKTNTGLSSLGMNKHVGFIYYSELVSGCPEEDRKRVSRILSAKCALAARIDRSREATDGSLGRKMKEEIESKIELMQQPPPQSATKALKAPDDYPKKRRAGKRVRRQKDKLAMTELRKAQNRVAFGQAEAEVGESNGGTVGLGMIGKEVGKVRAAVASTKQKINISKKYNKYMNQSQTSGFQTSGFTTSLSFTPVQGLELGNPDAEKQKIKDLNEKYFSNFKNPSKK